MGALGTAYVEPYVWKEKNGVAHLGAALFVAGHFRGFIPERDLLTISNRLVDISEDYDRGESC